MRAPGAERRVHQADDLRAGLQEPQDPDLLLGRQAGLLVLLCVCGLVGWWFVVCVSMCVCDEKGVGGCFP